VEVRARERAEAGEEEGEGRVANKNSTRLSVSTWLLQGAGGAPRSSVSVFQG
jgi:hypothetical protein